ncbi:MAG: DUF3558 family protein [Pseudonocardiaceae bacterium]
MIGRASVLSAAVLGAVLVLVSGCSPRGQSEQNQSGTSSDATAGTASPAGDITSKDFCALVSADQLTGVAFPVAAGQPLTVGASRACRFPASDGAGGPVPDSVMISAFPGPATGVGEPVTVEGRAGSQVLTRTECTMLLEAKGGTLQILVARAGKGPQQCAIAESVAAVVLDRL